MEIWLKQDKIEIRLPVIPESIEDALSYNNTEQNISSFGTVNMIGNRNLKTFPLTSFWPKKKYSFLQYTPTITPLEFKKYIQSMASAPVRLIITGAGINTLVTIEEMNFVETGGSGDLNYSLSLKEYRIPKLLDLGKNVAKKKKSKATKKVEIPKVNRSTKQVKSKTYVVKKGDTLMAIAKRETGSSENYRAIANQNNIKNPNIIYPGQKLVIQI